MNNATFKNVNQIRYNVSTVDRASGETIWVRRAVMTGLRGETHEQLKATALANAARDTVKSNTRRFEVSDFITDVAQAAAAF